MSRAKTAELTKMPFDMLSWVRPRKHVLDGGVDWRLLVNMIELSVCGSDASLCEFTLTICSFYKFISRHSLQPIDKLSAISISMDD